MNESRAKIRAMGRKIFEAKRARTSVKESEAKDILSLLSTLGFLSPVSSPPNDFPLVKSNLSSTLSDEDLLDQCSTFLFAGTDSVAIALTWALHHLSNHPQMQARLYDELKASLQTKGPEDYDSDGSDDSGFAEDPKLRSAQAQRDWTKSLESLPYLDTVVRETLRITPPIHSTIRVATKDDEIMLSEPISVDGRLSNSFKIQKGTFIHIPIEGINFAEDIWGPDALEFK
jgi:cytochrome P450